MVSVQLRLALLFGSTLVACGPGSSDSMAAEKVDLSAIGQPQSIQSVGFAPDGAPLVSVKYGLGSGANTFANYDTLTWSFEKKSWSVFGPPSRCLGRGPADTTLFCQVVPESGSVIEQHVQRLKAGGQLESLSDDPALPVILRVDADGNFYAHTIVDSAWALSVKLRAASTFTPIIRDLPDANGQLFMSQDGATLFYLLPSRALYRSASPTQFEKLIDLTTLANAPLTNLTPSAVSTDGSFYFVRPDKRELWRLPPGGNELTLFTTVPHGTVLSNVMADRQNRLYVQVRTTDGSTLERAGELYEYQGGSSWRLRLRYAGAVSHPSIAPNGSAYLTTLQASGAITDLVRIGN
ncbi:MAG: hypothetical protein Q8S33_24660 [Myxococcales bacterium]|nr:hypothetical protein [Myxococcales bacterium]